MVPQVVVMGPLAANNAALLAASQTPVSGTALTLTGSQPDTARRILLTYGNEGSARTLLLTGTNIGGNPITETLSVPSGGSGTVATQQDFLTVTSALPAGGGWTAAVTLGTNTVASSPWKTLDIFNPGIVTFTTNILSGSINYTIEWTADDPNNVLGVYNSPPVANAVPVMSALTAAASGEINSGAYAWRCTVNSGTGSMRASAIQNTLGGIR